jgi:predicted metallo-beta-lactamase superfamily hydrolase
MQVNLQSGQLYEEALLLLAEIQNTLNQDNSYQNSHILESITVIEQKLDQALENLSSIDQRTQIRFFIFEFYLNFRVSYLFSLEKIIFV